MKTERRYQFAYIDSNGHWIVSKSFFKTAEDFRFTRSIDENRPVVITQNYIDVPELTPEEIENYENHFKSSKEITEIKKKEKLEKENEFQNAVVENLNHIYDRLKKIEGVENGKI